MAGEWQDFLLTMKTLMHSQFVWLANKFMSIRASFHILQLNSLVIIYHSIVSGHILPVFEQSDDHITSFHIQ